jgi:hypothetical protein
MALRIVRIILFLLVCLLLGFCAVFVVKAWTSKPIAADPNLRMPGTQPGLVTIESPDRCLNCHAGYRNPVEPGFNWKGSMMAQAARDFLFYSCMTVAGQDSIWALGNPNAIDICERCHFPKGWLEGRSDPPNASAMTGADFDGVQCDLCHTLWDPFFKSTFTGARESSDWLNYWDETNNSSTPSQLAAVSTYGEDQSLTGAITTFSGSPFFSNNAPSSANYLENGSGQFFVSPNSAKRASFADAAARHQFFYSRYHKSRYFCGVCHDVSNPALANLGDAPNSLTTEQDSAYSYFHVERTFSEFMLSAYGRAGGSAGIGPFAPGNFETSKPGNLIATCQDCHMPDVVGPGCDKNGVLIRPDESIEHPQSGQPKHDLTGGNAWVSWVLASSVSGSSNYDAFNAQKLNQGSSILTLDLTQGLGVDPVSLLGGVDRARQQLLNAAAIQNLSYAPATGALSFRIQNQTGHKLISGFPEGRRMFVNIKAYHSSQLIYELNPYDSLAGTLKGLPGYTYDDPDNQLPDPQPLAGNEIYNDQMVYEMHASSSLTGEQETFHFALADGRYKDNRIPPKGFDISAAAERLSVPVWHGVEDPNYFTSAEYSGGYDDVSLVIPANADLVEVSLYYQTTSREYIEFLRDEINGDASTLTGNGAGGDPAYLVQSDPFFARLKAWGNTLWELWAHNKDVPGAAPFLMDQAAVGASLPAAFGKTAPEDGAADIPASASVLSWEPSNGATSYEYCLDTTPGSSCDASWINVGTLTSIPLGSLNYGAHYYWQVRAVNADGSTEADGGAWWSFTVEYLEICLPVVFSP